MTEQHVLNIAQTLVGHLLNSDKKKEELRDISAIGLRTVFAQLNANDPATKNVVETLANKLVQVCLFFFSFLSLSAHHNSFKGIVNDSDKTPAREQQLLEVLSVLLDLFGSLVSDCEALQTALVPLLNSSRQPTRKRAIDCLSLLAVVESDSLFKSLVQQLLEASESAKPRHARTLVQLFGAISKTVGYKLGPFLPRVVPLVAKHCDAASEDEDLREHCLQCFETLLRRCPADIAPHVDAIEALALKYLTFDPNYAADSDDEDDDGDGDQVDDMDADGDDGFDDDVDDGVGEDERAGGGRH